MSSVWNSGLAGETDVTSSFAHLPASANLRISCFCCGRDGLAEPSAASLPPWRALLGTSAAATFWRRMKEPANGKHGECRGLELAVDFNDCGDAMAIDCSCGAGCTGSLRASVLSVSHFTTVEADLAGAGGIELGLKEQAESRSRAAETSERGRSSEAICPGIPGRRELSEARLRTSGRSEPGCCRGS